jgi:endoribonuclease Dicer
MGWGNLEEVQQDSDLDESDIEPEVENNVDSGNSEDEQPDIDLSHAARTISEKRRAQNEIFRAYANRRIAQITENEVKEVMKNTKDEQLSIRNILATAENSRRITNPRDYQTELFQRAKEENIIAVLGTGTGKTHIATLLLRHILDVELEARAKGAPHKIAFFLVSSIFTLWILH